MSKSRLLQVLESMGNDYIPRIQTIRDQDGTDSRVILYNAEHAASYIGSSNRRDYQDENLLSVAIQKRNVFATSWLLFNTYNTHEQIVEALKPIASLPDSIDPRILPDKLTLKRRELIDAYFNASGSVYLESGLELLGIAVKHQNLKFIAKYFSTYLNLQTSIRPNRNEVFTIVSKNLPENHAAILKLLDSFFSDASTTIRINLIESLSKKLVAGDAKSVNANPQPIPPKVNTKQETVVSCQDKKPILPRDEYVPIRQKLVIPSASVNQENDSKDKAIKKLNEYSKNTKEFIDSFKNKIDGTKINLSDLEQKEFSDKFRDPISLDIIYIPMRLNGNLYDLQTLVDIKPIEGSMRIDPLTGDEFFLRDLQSDREIAQEIQNKLTTILQARKEAAKNSVTSDKISSRIQNHVYQAMR